MTMPSHDETTRANKAAVLRFNRDVIERGDEAAFRELMAPGFVNRTAAPGMSPGADGMRATFENVLRPALGELRVEIHDQVAEGDKVTTRKTIHGTHRGTLLGVPATGEPVAIDVIDLVRLEGGRYAEHWGVNTLPSVLAALRERAARTAESRVLLEEMTTSEIRDAIQAGKTTVLLCNASTEASGPHLAVGKHLVRARYVAERVARELGNALVAPIMPFAPTSDEYRFAGTVHLPAAVFSAVNEAVAESMIKTGFRYVVLTGDHDGNQDLLEALAPKLDAIHRAEGARVFFSGDGFAKAGREMAAYLSEHGYPPSRHGGVSDTSLLWGADGAYVRPDKLAVGAPVPPSDSPLTLGDLGWEGDPRRASPELGRMFLAWKVKNSVAEIRRLIDGAA
jgi:creatinine amidohydrolase